MPGLLVNGVSLYYEQSGEGPDVVLTHGFCDSAHLWDFNRQPLVDAGFRVTTWDMRGHYRSDAPEDPALYTQDLVVEDLHALLNDLSIARPVLGGHSLGGYTSMRFYEKYPNRCRALILSGTGPGYRNPQGMAAWTQRLDSQAHELEQHGRETVLDARKHRLGACPPNAPVGHRVAGLANVARGVMANPPLVDPSKLMVPTLVLVGERDVAFLDSAEFISSRAKEGTKVMVAGAGHACMFKQPTSWNAAVVGFLHALPAI